MRQSAAIAGAPQPVSRRLRSEADAAVVWSNGVVGPNPECLVLEQEWPGETISNHSV